MASCKFENVWPLRSNTAMPQDCRVNSILPNELQRRKSGPFNRSCKEICPRPDDLTWPLTNTRFTISRTAVPLRGPASFAPRTTLMLVVSNKKSMNRDTCVALTQN